MTFQDKDNLQVLISNLKPFSGGGGSQATYDFIGTKWNLFWTFSYTVQEAGEKLEECKEEQHQSWR